MSAQQYRFSNQSLFRALCGVADSQVAALEEMLDVQLIPRGQAFLIQTESEKNAERAVQFFEMLSKRYSGSASGLPESFDTEYLFRQLAKKQESKSDTSGLVMDEDDAESLPEALKARIFTTIRGRVVYARTARQAAYVQSMLDNSVTFGLGPAGTGKTFLSIVSACRLLSQGTVDRIILTRPAVEAGESLGFLPGDLAQKVDPYLRPIYDALYECLGMEKVHQEVSARRIEIAPLAYMRGRTLNDSAIILDEAQNCTLSQLKMFLTRLGRNSRMCIGGDVTQIDLQPGKSGLLQVVGMLREVKDIGVVEFQNEDIIRNPLVERIVRAFEAWPGTNGSPVVTNGNGKGGREK
ncbi:MAG: PhoH family protein [Spirochaetia bacterium]|nr:PhoH family protein [Spirochaetia bacterium]